MRINDLQTIGPLICDGRIPPATQFLDRANIHYSVMQASNKLRHVDREEGSVSVYRISCQHGGALFWDPLLNVGKYLAGHAF